MIDFEALADFIAVADTRGISLGAKRRGVPKQSVSRRLIALERRMGVRLFDRSNRALRLTPEGEMLRVRALQLLSDVADTNAMFSEHQTQPQGLLRVSVPHLLGHTLMGSIAAALLRDYPELLLDIVTGDQRVDLVDDGFDAAIRVGQFEDSGLVSRLIGPARTVLVAAPAMVAAHGAPKTPDDLANWPAVRFGTGDRTRVTLPLRRGDERHSLQLNSRLSATAFKLCLDAVAGGAGVTMVPLFLARPDLAAGTLVHLLPDWELPPAEMRIIFPSRRLQSARLRVFIDEATRQLRAAEI